MNSETMAIWIEMAYQQSGFYTPCSKILGRKLIKCHCEKSH